jgi:hypothetical protein
MGSCAVQAQTEIKENILGKWQLVTEQITVNTTNSASDAFLRKEIILWFRDKETLSFELEAEALAVTVPYSIKDSLLLISNRTYRIVHINKEKLRFKVQNDSLQATFNYQRIKRQVAKE